mgnify:CR=1 FL=1
MVKLLTNLFKLRIGVIMAITALVALVVTPGQPVPVWQAAVLTIAVLLAASSAGAFNQYYERDLDGRMRRTRNRPFVTGELSYNRWWLLVITCVLNLMPSAPRGYPASSRSCSAFDGRYWYCSWTDTG